eukprot:9459719-Alexandrium_andersonii.AAC.1
MTLPRAKALAGSVLRRLRKEGEERPFFQHYAHGQPPCTETLQSPLGAASRRAPSYGRERS